MNNYRLGKMLIKCTSPSWRQISIIKRDFLSVIALLELLGCNAGAVRENAASSALKSQQSGGFVISEPLVEPWAACVWYSGWDFSLISSFAGCQPVSGCQNITTILTKINSSKNTGADCRRRHMTLVTGVRHNTLSGMAGNVI